MIYWVNAYLRTLWLPRLPSDVNLERTLLATSEDGLDDFNLDGAAKECRPHGGAVAQSAIA